MPRVMLPDWLAARMQEMLATHRVRCEACKTAGRLARSERGPPLRWAQYGRMAAAYLGRSLETSNGRVFTVAGTICRSWPVAYRRLLAIDSKLRA